MDADRLATPLHGIPASPGVARGCLHLVPTEPGPIVEAPGDPNREWHRLVAALDQAGEELDRLSEDLAREGPSESAEIVATQRRYLDDPEVLATARASIFAERLGAAAAWWRATEAAAARYEQIDDPYLRERSADLPEVNRRISRLLSGGEEAGPLGSESMIFVGAEMGPAEVAGLDRSVVRGICLAHGGPTSHAAILARGLGIPVVVGLGRRLLELPTGTPLLVDGATGLVWPNPEPPILERYAGQLTASPAPSVPSAPVDRAPGPTRARDGLAIAVLANVGSLAEARTAATAGAEGVGLLRTEFLFLGRSEPPSEDEQVAAYRDIVEALSGRPVTIRTLDAGGDKSLPYLHLDPEVNPFLGRRSIRLSLARPDLFAIQLRAILRVAAATPVRVMFPLIATLAELQEARAFLDECLNQLREQGLAIPGAPDVGMMVEVPAAALLADEFSMAVDFLSIGTNDLAQYTLAADRGNPSVAALADPFHPAVLQLIAQTVRAARVHSKASSVCGEMAADPLAIPLLVGLGVDALSVAPAAIPSVRQTIAEVESSKARTLAERALRLGTADAVRDLLKTANQREGRQDGPTA